MLTAGQASPYTLQLASFYLDSPVERAHQIKLDLEAEVQGRQRGTLHLDPNTCQVNEWGDRTICTKMAVQGIEVVVTRTRAQDPTGHGRVLHGVTSPTGAVHSLALIEYPKVGVWYLVWQQKDGPTRIVPLYSLPA